jgi:hypothetical protein
VNQEMFLPSKLTIGMESSQDGMNAVLQCLDCLMGLYFTVGHYRLHNVGLYSTQNRGAVKFGELRGCGGE